MKKKVTNLEKNLSDSSRPTQYENLKQKYNQMDELMVFENSIKGQNEEINTFTKNLERNLDEIEERFFANLNTSEN